VTTTPTKSAQLLSPKTVAKIEKSKAAAKARKAIFDSTLKAQQCVVCTEDLPAQNEHQVCVNCLPFTMEHCQETPVHKAPDTESTSAGGVKKQKRIKKVMHALKIDFDPKAINSGDKTRAKKSPKVYDS
jgi:hypothetical protein